MAFLVAQEILDQREVIDGVWGAKTEGSGFAVTVASCVTAVVLRSRQIFELAIGQECG